MPNFQMFSLLRSLRSKLALAALLWLALLSCLSWPAPAAAQTINFEPPVFLHPDLNGNTVMASNAAGQIIWQERLEPYGKKSVPGNSAADQGFHGKTRDEETGLIYFGARHYHPLLGRFLSMDPVETQSDNLHSFNRYAFANNNPYKYTDPDGQIPLPIIAYYGYQGVVALTPIVSGLAVRFAASRVMQFGIAAGAGEIGLAVPTAAAGAAAAKGGSLLLQAPRQIEAAWGASTYRHGGLMTSIEHVMYRHGPNSGFANVSRFSEGTRMGDISRYVDSALRSGTVTSTGTSAYTVEYNLGRTIGTDIAGNAASNIRVHIRDGVIQTAFPF